jgi:hypothetical protein
MYLRTIAMLQVDPKLRQIYISSSENLQTKRRVKPCKIGYHQKDKKQNKKNQPRISYISKKNPFADGKEDSETSPKYPLECSDPATS